MNSQRYLRFLSFRSYSSISSATLLHPREMSSQFSSLRQRYKWFSTSARAKHSKRLANRRFLGTQIAKSEKEDEEKSKKEGKSEEFRTLVTLGLVGCIIYFLFYEEKHQPEQIEEYESQSKRSADSLIDNIPNDGKIRRVKQNKRLPLDLLAENGLKHGQLEGTKWTESNGDYFIQTYWNDEAAYKFSIGAVTTLRDASWELHHMCLEAVDLVVSSDELMDIFEIPMNLRSSIRESWNSHEPDLLGRFDFLWDGIGNPKLLEYNADTPTVLVESSLGQQLWFEHVMLSNDNVSMFNNLHNRLIEAWKYHIRVPPSSSSSSGAAGAGTSEINSPSLIFLKRSSYELTTEDVEHENYLKKTAKLAGIHPTSIDATDFNYQLLREMASVPDFPNESDNTTTKTNNSKNIRYVWKGYPYEYLSGIALGMTLFQLNEASSSSSSPTSSSSSSSPSSSTSEIHLIEPSWKIILGNKAILALLWEMYPDHPYLLYSTYDRQEAIHDSVNRMISIVRKPKYGREGNGISILPYDSSKTEPDVEHNWEEMEKHAAATSTDDDYYGESIFQEYHDIQRFHGRKIVIGSWIIRGKPSGICVREDVSNITNDNSSIVPHYVNHKRDENNKTGIYSPSFKSNLPTLSDKQLALRKKLYPEEYPSPPKENKEGGGRSGGGGGSGGGGSGGGGWYWWNRGWNTSSNTTTGTSGTSTNTTNTNSNTTGSNTTTGSTPSKEDGIRSKAKQYHQKRWPGGNQAGTMGGKKFGNGTGRGTS